MSSASASDSGSFRLGLGGVGGRRIRGSAEAAGAAGADSGGAGSGADAVVASGGLTSSALGSAGFGVSSGCLAQAIDMENDNSMGCAPCIFGFLTVLEMPLITLYNIINQLDMVNV